MTSKSLARLRITSILKVIVTYRKFSIRLLHIRIIHYTDIATTENRTLVRITSYRKLSQVQTEFLPQINRKYKRCHRFVSSPMLLSRIPSQRSIPSNHLAVLSLQNSQGISDVIASFMELGNREGTFAGSVEEVGCLDVGFGEQRLDIVMFVGDFAIESWYLIAIGRNGGGEGHLIFFIFSEIKILDSF